MRTFVVTTLTACSLSGLALVGVSRAEEDLVIRKGTVAGSAADKVPAVKPAADKPAADKSAASKNAPAGAAAKSPAKPRREARRIDIKPSEGQSLAAAWDAWFAKWKKLQPKDEAALERATADLERDIRETSRRLVAEERYDEAVAVFEAALRNSTPRPWMYEALSVAMQAAGASPAELERT